MVTVKFSNGNTLEIHHSGGYRIVNLIKANVPLMWLVGHGYQFAKKMVYREVL